MNLLFMFTDEQRADTLGAYGNPLIRTPNLDRLAKRSMVFEKCYVTQSVCTPSRSTLLTGLWPHQSGCTANNLPLPAQVPCFPEMLPAGKCTAAYHGKWHLGDEIFAQHGFGEWRSIDDGYRKYYRPDRDRNARSTYHDYLLAKGFTPGDGTAFGRGEVARLPEEHSKPAYLAREASRFIRENRANPFVLFVNFFEPHMPFTGPRDEQYDPGSVALPLNFDHAPGTADSLKARMFARFYRDREGWNLNTEKDWRALIARYWGLCSQVDTHAGAILKTLEECGLMDETVIVYTSDHGDMMGSHKLVAKSVMYEEAVRVPFLLRAPGALENGRCALPVSQIDLLPTLLDLMAEKGPEGLPGRSLRRFWEGGAEPEDVFIQWNRGKGNNDFDSMMATGEFPSWLTEMAPLEDIKTAIQGPSRAVLSREGWKLNLNPAGPHELFSLNDDPLEVRNMAGDAGQRDRMRDLASRIRKWQDEVRDPMELPAL